MPTRLLRDGILTSERINRLSVGAELFYRRLMSVTDDYGRFSGDLRLLRASCYPLKLDSVKEDSIAKHLAECADAGVIVLYTVAAKPYLEVQDFGQRTQAKSRYPGPNDACSGFTVDHGGSPLPTVDHGDPRWITAIGGDVVGDEDVVEGGGGKAPPTGRKNKAEERTLPDWVNSLEGGDAVLANDPIFDWAAKTGVPAAWISLAWWAFEGRYQEGGKKYRDWRAVFRKAVKEDWLKLWRPDLRSGGWILTTAGEMTKREMDADGNA